VPRAKPSRSGQSATRHLLRNLDDARELRRNPLVAGYFATTARSRRRTPDEDVRSLERIRGLARTALLALYEERDSEDRDGTHLGRMHAALLRCEIDRHAPELVSAELGLSERQLRRERSAAHDAFLRAFRRSADAERAPEVDGREHTPAACRDVADLRLTEAIELHCIGQGRLGLSVFASIAEGAPTLPTRLEAMCMAVEAELDAGRVAEAETLITEAKSVYALHGLTLGEIDRAVFEEHVEYLEWGVRWQYGLGGGVAMRPPSIIARPAANLDWTEKRRALRVRALVSYASQRWEVGDFALGIEAVQAGYALLPTLHPTRIREHLGIMLLEAQLHGLNSRCGEHDPLLFAVEVRAAKFQHVRPLFAARGERTGLGGTCPPGAFDLLLEEFSAVDFLDMRRSLAHVACALAQRDPDLGRAIWAIDFGESLTPPHSGLAMLNRSMLSGRSLRAERYGDATRIAKKLRLDATRAGNSRLRAAANRDLAIVACLQGRQREARYFVRSALPYATKYGTRPARDQVQLLGRRLGVA
jgi:hypothetical protein